MSSFIADRRPLPRLVVLLSIVSLLNDVASEMITPLLPLVVAGTLGGGPLVISAIEGLAEASSSLLKLASGWLADRGWSLRWMVFGGYSLSNLARPLIGLASVWGAVMALRLLDRAGKGIRTSPRDALISAAVETAERGRAFGFHRAMDHGGAIVGPLLAWPLLASGVSPQNVFVASAVPGVLLLVVLWYALPARPAAPTPPVARPRWSILDRRLQGLIVAAAALTLATFPEALLVLWVHEVGGVETLWVPVLWAVAHVIKVFLAYAAGTVSDRVGRLPVVIAGWGARVVVLLGIAAGAAGVVAGTGLFLFYAAALSCTEAAERALIGDVAPADQKGTAFGAYHFVCSLLALPGALLFGWLWEKAGITMAFSAAALGTVIAALVLGFLTRRRGTGPVGRV